MVKISTKGRYALEAVVDLAINSSAGHENLKNIAERRGFSENYLEQIFVHLRRKGIVESIRGAQGGYRLSRDADKITAGEIIRATEGDMAVVPCISTIKDGNSETCDKVDICTTRLLWSKVTDKLNEVADSVTIADLVEKYQNMRSNTGYEYYI